MTRRHPNIANLDESPWVEGAKHGTRIGYHDKWLAHETGGKKLGASYYEVAPGKAAFSMHAHLVNEEALFILSGVGRLRLGKDEYDVRAGDYVTCVPGLDHAHQLIAAGTEPLRYLCLSTMQSPEVAVWPDANKIGVLGGDAVPLREMYFREDARTGPEAYFEREPEGYVTPSTRE